MKRRKFLGVLSLGAIGTAVGILALPDFDKMIEKILLKDTEKLNIEDGAIQKYLQSARENNLYARFNFGKREFIRGHYLISNDLFTLPYHAKYNEYRSEIVGNFLLSTDFFSYNMDENRKIRYIALYDPYFRPCANPFSNLYYT